MLYYLRIILAAIFFGINGVISLIPLLLRPFHPDNARLAAKIVCPFILKLLGIKLVVIDEELLDPNSAKIYIANHQDTIDVFVLGCVFPKNTISIGKKAVKWIPVFGWIYWLSGHRLIDRKNREKAIATLEKVEREVLKEGTSLWIFPEGTRSRGRGLGEFKKGAFYSAVNNKVAIQPIVVSSYSKHIQLKHWNAGEAHVKILPPIDTSSYNLETVNDLRLHCFEVFKSAQDKLDQQYAKK